MTGLLSNTLKNKTFYVLIEPTIERSLSTEAKKPFFFFRKEYWMKDIAGISIIAYWWSTKGDIGVEKRKGIFFPV